MKWFMATISVLFASSVLADAELRFDDGSEILISDGRVMFGDDDSSIIYPGSGTTMTVLEHENRRYMIIDEEFVDSVSEQMEAAMAEVQSQLAMLPPEQRERMQAMLKQRMPGARPEVAAREFRSSGRSEEVSGFTCTSGELFKDGEKELEICVSSPGKLGMSKKDYKSLLAAFSAMSSLVGKFSPGAGELFDLEVVGGVPIRSNNFALDKESRLVWANFEKVDAKRLAVPDDYEQRDPTGM